MNEIKVSIEKILKLRLRAQIRDSGILQSTLESDLRSWLTKVVAWIFVYFLECNKEPQNNNINKNQQKTTT